MKGLMTALLAALLVSVSVRAADQQQNSQNNEPSTTTSGPPGYAQVTDDDKQMDRAVENAQKNLGFFIAALKAKKDGDSVFEIKKGFIDGDKVEHLWIRQITFDGKNFHGQIDNRPVDVRNVHSGQRVKVAPEDVTDWMFLKDGKLIGGYTTRVFYARLSPEDKAAFDQQAGFKVE